MVSFLVADVRVYYLRNKTVGNTITERDEGHDYKRWQHITDIMPVDLSNLADHHTSDLFITNVRTFVY